MIQSLSNYDKVSVPQSSSSLPIKNLINFQFQLNLILNLKVEDNVVLKKWLNSNVKQFFVITFISVILTLILFSTHIYDYIVNGTVFSGAGDGFRQ